MVESAWANIGFCLYQFDPEVRRRVGRLECLYLKILKKKQSAVFNQTCLDNKYTIYIYIYKPLRINIKLTATNDLTRPPKVTCEIVDSAWANIGFFLYHLVSIQYIYIYIYIRKLEINSTVWKCTDTKKTQDIQRMILFSKILPPKKPETFNVGKYFYIHFHLYIYIYIYIYMCVYVCVLVSLSSYFYRKLQSGKCPRHKPNERFKSIV